MQQIAATVPNRRQLASKWMHLIAYSERLREGMDFARG
jgi:hypothetical protein